MIERVNDVIYAGKPLPGNPLTTVPRSPSSGGEAMSFGTRFGGGLSG